MLSLFQRRKTQRKPKKLLSNLPKSVQQSIPYTEMYPDGICKVSESFYTKVIQFNDINYQIAGKEDQKKIFSGYCDLLNAFDNSIYLQFLFQNQMADFNDMQRFIRIPDKNDDFNAIRREYSDMLKNQLEKGTNGFIRTKYLIFGIKESGKKAAKIKLEQTETVIINNFRKIGVHAYSLSGKERLELLRYSFHPLERNRKEFDWNDRIKKGISTKDFIAPMSLDFSKVRSFRMGGAYGASYYLNVDSNEISDRIIVDFLNEESNISISMHTHSMDQVKAIKFVKDKYGSLNSSKISKQTKAANQGYDIDILPPEMEMFGTSIMDTLKSLQTRNNRLFLNTIIITAYGTSPKKVDTIINKLKSIAQTHTCTLNPLDNMQEYALMSSVPIGINFIEIERSLTTSEQAAFMPFTTQELFQPGEAQYYGLNVLSNNMLRCSRKRLKNPNALFLGVPGAGKSFSAKREIIDVFLTTSDDIMLCDPESEYTSLTTLLNGTVIEISSNSQKHLNPMDINSHYGDEKDPVSVKSEFILSLCEIAMGSKFGLDPAEKSIIDRCVRKVYQKYISNPIPENMPVLGDLYHALRQVNSKAANNAADALEIYFEGSLNIFNHRTNVDINNRLVCFDIKKLGAHLKKFAMLVIQDQMWHRVSVNRSRRATWFYMDEFHLYLQDEQTAAYCTEFWRRFRKWNGIPTGITQNVKQLLHSTGIESILDNTDFIYMLAQASGDREVLARRLNISPEQLSYVTNSGCGEGLIYYSGTIIPFKHHFPRDTQLYRIMTTKPDESINSPMAKE